MDIHKRCPGCSHLDLRPYPKGPKCGWKGLGGICPRGVLQGTLPQILICYSTEVEGPDRLQSVGLPGAGRENIAVVGCNDIRCPGCVWKSEVYHPKLGWCSRSILTMCPRGWFGTVPDVQVTDDQKRFSAIAAMADAKVIDDQKRFSDIAEMADREALFTMDQLADAGDLLRDMVERLVDSVCHIGTAGYTSVETRICDVRDILDVLGREARHWSASSDIKKKAEEARS